MCGIVGLLSRRSNGFFGGELDMMEQLLTLDTMRGMDSTGVFCVHNSKKISVLKHATHPLHTFKTEEWNKFRSSAVSTGRLLVGHNRKATHGSVSSENAHPFVESNIILVHNGTLRGHKELADKDVDSHAVCHAFAERGAEEVIPTLDGAFAFVWWDTKKERLFAIRNDERPLSFVITEDAIAIASEPWMATALFSRNGKKVLSTEILEPGEMHSIGLDLKRDSSWVKLKPKTVQVYQQQGGQCHNFFPQDGDDFDSTFVAGNEGRVVPFRVKGDQIAAITRQMAIEDARARNDGAKSVPALVRSTNTKDENFAANEIVLVEFNRFTTSSKDSRVQAYGKVISPNKPAYDVTCFLPSIVDISRCENWQKTPVIAEVSVAVASNCGPSLWLHTPRMARRVKTNSDEITEFEWQHICDNEKCSHCQAKIYDEERSFTSVSRSYGNKFRITCADCVADKLPEGEMKNEFIKRRDTALQTGESVGAPPLTAPDHQAESSSTPTVH